MRPLIEARGHRDFAYNEWDLRAGRVGVALDLRTVRTRRHRMTVEMNSGAGELYDLHDDPHELHDRYDDEACRTVRRELADMITEGRNGLPTPALAVVGTA